MLKVVLAILLFLCSAILVMSCYTPRYVYSPAAQNVAALTKKGDSRIAILYSTNSGSNNDIVQYDRQSSNGLDIHFAYALNNHLFTQFNFYYRKEQNSNLDNNNATPELIRYKRNLGEIALGYYTAMNAGEKSFFYLLGSAGLGNFGFKDYAVSGNSIYYKNFHDASVFKFSVQPALLFKFKKRFAIAFASKLSFIDYRNIETNYNEQQLDLYKLKDLEKGLVSFWEPALVVNYHFKKLPYLQLEGQIGSSFLLNSKFVDSRTINVSIGVAADIAHWLWRKPSVKK